MFCYKAHCPYILDACPWCKGVPTNPARDSWGVPVQPELTPASQAFNLNLTRRLHSYTSTHSPGREHPSLQVLCSLCALWGHWPILIPFAPTWGFFKRINSEQDHQGDLWDMTLCWELRYWGVLQQKESWTPQHTWVAVLALWSQQGMLLLSLSMKMATAILIKQNRVHKNVCEAFCKHQGDELASLKGSRN